MADAPLPTTEDTHQATPVAKSRSTSASPPPSSQLPTSQRAPVRTPTPSTPQLTSPPPTAQLSNTTALAEAAAAVLYSHDQVTNASPEELRSMVDHLTNALRDMRLSAAHYKLQHNMAVIESQEAASRMAVELAMAHRELDVLQQAEAKRRQLAAAPDPSYAESANAANAVIMAEMTRQHQLLQAENEQLRDLFEQQKRLTEHREGELASLIDENDRLKSRIRKNRDHMAPLLEQMHEHSSPRSTFGTPHQPTPRRLHRTPLSNDNLRGTNNFEALLLADKMLSQETATAPTTPRTATHAPRSRGHHRGAQSMSSLPNTPNRRSHPYARPPRTPPSYRAAAIPQSAPPAHYQQKPAHERRQSSNSTITASSVDEEEAFTDREEDHINESQASQMAANMLRQAPPPPSKAMHAPPSANLVQSKIFGHVKKGHSSARPKDFDKRRPETTAHYASPRARVDHHGVGLGIGGLRE
ncbi:FAD-dependent oxidoreductase-like enzyme [Stagonosporopsis vannaccii]|nr:FAD-dependent oxidoreductase-like enzyme [Stagonosporopsis vannaccii]